MAAGWNDGGYGDGRREDGLWGGMEDRRGEERKGLLVREFEAWKRRLYTVLVRFGDQEARGHLGTSRAQRNGAQKGVGEEQVVG